MHEIIFIIQFEVFDVNSHTNNLLQTDAAAKRALALDGSDM